MLPPPHSLLYKKEMSLWFSSCRTNKSMQTGSRVISKDLVQMSKKNAYPKDLVIKPYGINDYFILIYNNVLHVL